MGLTQWGEREYVELKRRVEHLFARGEAHRRRLDAVDIRISVMGSRGKSTVTEWIHDALLDRGYDTYAKVTGTRPLSIYNGFEQEILREGVTRLYENETELKRNSPCDAMVVENQGITGYTTRLVNEQYVDPDVVVLTNVRRDHLDTLGDDPRRIAQSLARAVPEGATLVSGERNDELHAYLDIEFDRRDIDVHRISVPEEHAHIPGVTAPYAVNRTLELLGEKPIPAPRIARYLDHLKPEWTTIPDGKVYNAASVNDPESTEVVRRSLLNGDPEPIEPLIYLRRDRPGRTASYIEYLDTLYEAGHIERIHAVDGHLDAFAYRLDTPIERYTSDEYSPAEVLDAALAAGRPVMLMGNTVPEFMKRLAQEIEERVDDSERRAERADYRQQVDVDDRTFQFTAKHTGSTDRRLAGD